MTEKRFTQEQINKISNEIFITYHELFKSDKMSFHDWILIKSIITELQIAIDESDIE